MAITFYPKQNELARAEEAASTASLSSSRNWIVSGLALSAGTGLNAAVSAGRAWINGYVLDWDAATEVAVSASNTNHIYIILNRDGNENVTSVAFSVNTTGTPPAQDHIALGTATADGSGVTGTATTGRSAETQEDVIAAEDVTYDNSTSGLTATDVQGAVDELAARPTSAGWDGVVAKTTDTARNSSASATDDPNLLFAAVANKTYIIKIECYVSYGAGDFRIDFSAPAGSTGTYNYGSMAENSTFVSGLTLAGQGVSIGTETGFNVPGTKLFASITAVITTDATPGNIVFQWGQNTSQPADTTLHAGSFIMWKDIT